MTTDYVAIGFMLLVTIGSSLALGRYMFKVFTGAPTWLDPILVPIERLILRVTGVDPSVQQDWKRYSISLLVSNVVLWLEDVLALLDAGIHVLTAVNIQHLETLNDAVARATGVRVRETVPDTFLDRADEVINVDVTVDELRTRLREGKVYRPEKVEQALSNFFKKGNLSTLRELALRAVADEVSEKAATYRSREGLEPALIPERVMVCMSSNALAPRVIRMGARIAGRLGSRWYAVYVETPGETPSHISAANAEALQQNIRLAENLGATVVRVKARRPAEGLIAFAQREGVTHVIFGQSARSRWDLLWHGSTLDRFLAAVPDAAVQVVPLTS